MKPGSRTISAVRPSRKVAGYYSVYVDLEYAFSLTELQVKQYGLRVGLVLSEAEFSALSSDIESRKLRDAAYRILARRSHSIKELTTKLLKRGFEKRAVTSLTEELEQKGILSDSEFADQWIRNRLQLRPRSRKLLEAELISKGVKRAVAQEVLDRHFQSVSESDVALELLRKDSRRFRAENSIDSKRKMYNFLRYRGFDYEAIRLAADEFLKEVSSDNTDSTRK